MIFEYIKEAYVRILFTCYTFITSFCCLFAYRKEILCAYLDKIIELLGESHFQSTGFGEVFISYLWFCLVFGLFFTFWILLLNIFLFLLPGLYESEASKLIKLLGWTAVICLGVLLIIQKYILALFCEYLLAYGGEQGMGLSNAVTIEFQPRFGETVNFLLKLTGVLLLLVGSLCICLSVLGLSSEDQILQSVKKWRKWVYLGIILSVIILFPADILLHLGVFLFISVIFEIGCLLLFFKKSYEFAWWNR